jgi:4'-phosphopantetheinyl transferase
MAGPVGLDVERVPVEVVATALAPEERTAVETAANPLAAFVVCWTRKEAATKAISTGLRLEPDEVVVSPPSQPARLLSWPADVAASEVALFDLVAQPGYSAAAAVVGASDGVVELNGSPVLAATARRYAV